jgi:hypothetical protein
VHPKESRSSATVEDIDSIVAATQNNQEKRRASNRWAPEGGVTGAAPPLACPVLKESDRE